MMITRRAWPLLLVLLTSCASSPPVDYYTLDAISSNGGKAPVDAAIFGVGPLEIAGYLDRPQLVTRESGGRVKLDEFNRWAEPLSDLLPRVVTSNLDVLLDSTVVVAFPYGPQVRASYRLVGRITRFDADQFGNALLEVQWSVVDADAHPILAPQRSRYTSKATSPESAGSIVEALNQTVNTFTLDVKDQLRKLNL